MFLWLSAPGSDYTFCGYLTPFLLGLKSSHLHSISLWSRSMYIPCRDPAGPMHHLLLQSLSLHTPGISSSLRGILLQCWPVMAEAEFHCSQSHCPWLLMLRLTMCAINGSPLCRVSGSGFSSLLATIAQVTCSESLRQQALILGHANSCLASAIFMSHAPYGLLFVETEKRAGNSVDKILLFLLPGSGP